MEKEGSSIKFGDIRRERKKYNNTYCLMKLNTKCQLVCFSMTVINKPLAYSVTFLFLFFEDVNITLKDFMTD